MSGQSVLGPQLVAAERGSLVLTDISGYTSYLLGTELEHAQDVLTDLMGIVVQSLQPVLRVSKLEGDAISRMRSTGRAAHRRSSTPSNGPTSPSAHGSGTSGTPPPARVRPAARFRHST